MRLSGYQPQYFPRLHYFNRILSSDIFEISDYIQFVKKHKYQMPDGTFKRGKSYQAHSPIKMASGLEFLTVSLPDDLLPINKIKINYREDWPSKHLRTIETAYSRSKNFAKFYPELKSLLSVKYDDLALLNSATIYWSVIRFLADDKISIKDLSLEYLNEVLKKQSVFPLKKVVVTSKTPVPPPEKGEANKWIVSLCKYLNADEYFYGGTSLNAYMDNSMFIQNNIKTVLQDWHCREYQQQFSKVGFIANLSALDLILNEPLKLRQEIIK